MHGRVFNELEVFGSESHRGLGSVDVEEGAVEVEGDLV
eukprot:CAMPEP_0170478588 /NCGR_PEP_ID=MMETSP0208-20121228/56_1 /TAXON_ID=197538 /ORGANISM="Strombidium inclinatum, Strain S3" /LENGTH=37 /DNA_ID= /DNA_START= /DNA_END= /DNA_ORIENTATION=